MNSCFNCATKISESEYICPNCYAVQRQDFTQDELFDNLEKMYPTKPVFKERLVSTKVLIEPKDYNKWLILGILTLGFAYYYYLLMVFKDLSNHWYYPHGKYENSTDVDILIMILIMVFTNFLGIPFVQYVKYEKLRRHLQKAPHPSDYIIPNTGKFIFWFYTLLVILFVGVFLMLFFGISSFVAGRYFEFNSLTIAIIFFVIAGVIFLLALVLTIVLLMLESNWQMQFNQHLNWHLKDIKSKKGLMKSKEQRNS